MDILMALKEKVYNTKKQMYNIDREIKTLRKNQKEILEIKIQHNKDTECSRWAHL